MTTASGPAILFTEFTKATNAIQQSTADILSQCNAHMPVLIDNANNEIQVAIPVQKQCQFRKLFTK